ncbi:MAG: hypothetical protein HZB34_02010 [Nitrospirae bacterium]|nr:hypothetical protein [Nitrospirota bacterium]
MKLRKWLENWDMTSLKINVGILETEWQPQEKDREAAWELYIEMLTRIVTQPLPQGDGDEKSTLDSVHALFGITREILRRKGRDCVQFTKIAVVVLNQIIRPFTAKWHRMCLGGAFNDPGTRQEFRNDLSKLQVELRKYTKALADIAEVEDLSALAFENTAD